MEGHAYQYVFLSRLQPAGHTTGCVVQLHATYSSRNQRAALLSYCSCSGTQRLMSACCNSGNSMLLHLDVSSSTHIIIISSQVGWCMWACHGCKRCILHHVQSLQVPTVLLVTTPSRLQFHVHCLVPTTSRLLCPAVCFAVMQHYLDCGSLGSSERLIHGLPWRLWSRIGCYRPLDLLQATIRRPGRQRDSHQPRPCKRVRGCSRNVHCQSRCLQLGGRVTRTRCGRVVGLLQGAER